MRSSFEYLKKLRDRDCIFRDLYKRSSPSYFFREIKYLDWENSIPTRFDLITQIDRIERNLSS